MLAVPNQPEPSQQGSTPTRVWTRRLIFLLTILTTLVLAGMVIWGASHVITTLLIIAVGALVAYAIVPVVELFHRFMPRALAILLAYLLVLVTLAVILYMVVGTAVTQVSSIAQSVSIWLRPARNGQSPLLVLLGSVGLTASQIASLREQLTGSFANIGGSLVGGLVPLLGGVASSLLNILLTVVISIYLLVDGSRTVTWLRNATPRSRRGQINSTIDTLQHVVGGYIRGQFSLCIVIGLLVGVGLFLLRFPFAAFMGVLTFITEFIPVLGTIIGGTIAILLALTQGWTMTITVLVFFIVVHLVEGYVLAPRLVGKSVELNPAIMLIALTAGGELFGPFGAIFAAPTAGVLQALFTALWIQYRSSHTQEFQDQEPILGPPQPAELQLVDASSTAQ